MIKLYYIDPIIEAMRNYGAENGFGLVDFAKVHQDHQLQELLERAVMSAVDELGYDDMYATVDDILKDDARGRSLRDVAYKTYREYTGV